jgi:RNA polymerase sigma-70 factor (ECF subfamily)
MHAMELGPEGPHFSPADLARYADDLRRFARRRVRDDALAEDAVQDALVAALVSLPSFHGASSLKTWLFGILTHKIQDAFRRETR